MEDFKVFKKAAGTDVTKPYKFIGFGAMDVTKPYKFIGFGAMDVMASIPARTHYCVT